MFDIRIAQIQLIRVFARWYSASFAMARYATAGWLFFRMSMLMPFRIVKSKRRSLRPTIVCENPPNIHSYVRPSEIGRADSKR